ncbi:UNVERIFIED_CONTAM: hypothetical protein Sradi_7120700 [Sesamum radiatum]|uniref:Uncharacterized protein n=1 Tax=Sesamum radiatum TaxID=300843 RepID=A0AAW2IZK0_SESRA
MISLVEKLEDLKAGLDNDTYIDVILQSLPPSYNPFIINYNMKELEKTIHELIDMLVQYEAMTHKSAPTVLIGEASTSKTKSKSAGHWKRRRVRERLSQLLLRRGRPCCSKGKGKREGWRFNSQRQMISACIVKERGIGRGSVHNSSPTQVCL